MLRFAGGLHLVAGRVVVEAELDSAAVARRLHGIIADMYGHRAELAVLAPSGIRRTTRYLVRVEREGGMLARQAGLLDARGRPVRGMPPFVVGGALVDAESAWRGAFLARGTVTEPGRSSALGWRWRWSARPGASASPRRPGRRGARTGWCCATATRSPPCCPGWAPTRRCAPGSSAAPLAR